uniref:Uncharacterized protein n=1 Tax=Oryza meridionalis TaxID=40149 RepID=A0A0E0DX70_9ORYZ
MKIPVREITLLNRYYNMP